MASVIHLCWLLFGLSNQLLNCVIWIIYDYSLSLNSLTLCTHSKNLLAQWFLLRFSPRLTCAYVNIIVLYLRYYCRYVGVRSVLSLAYARGGSMNILYSHPNSHAFDFFAPLFFNSNRFVWRKNINKHKESMSHSLSASALWMQRQNIKGWRLQKKYIF